MSDDSSGGAGGPPGGWGGSPDGVVRDPAASADLDRFLDVITDRRRRYLLYYLVGRQDEAVERAELTEAVCEYECAGLDAPDEPDPEAVSIDLHHRVLPRLDDVGVVDFDARHGTIRVGCHPALTSLLEVTFDHEFAAEEGER